MYCFLFLHTHTSSLNLFIMNRQPFIFENDLVRYRNPLGKGEEREIQIADKEERLED